MEEFEMTQTELILFFRNISRKRGAESKDRRRCRRHHTKEN